LNSRTLRSWREIAEYLKVSVRTAKRWREKFGLPVRFTQERQGGEIYAIADEIDQWLKENPEMRALAKAAPDEPGQPPPSEAPVELTDLEYVIITDHLWNRPPRPPTYDREIEALRKLVLSMAGQGHEEILEIVSQAALDLCKAESSGLGLLEKDETGQNIIRVVAANGPLAKYEGSTYAQHGTACSLSLERNAPQLLHYPERHFSYLRDAAPIVELLTVPLYGEPDWIGTIWVAVHNRPRRFDREDVRCLERLAEITSAVLTAKPKAEAPENPKAKGTASGADS